MPEHAAIALVGLDWGTTSLRAHAFSPAGEVLGTALVEASFRIVEVPLNSPEPLASIRGLVAAVGSEATVGAGRVAAVRSRTALPGR
jgi:2-keto-3-deoxy-6-phosphogluconate aldolase